MSQQFSDLLCPNFYKFVPAQPDPIPGQVVSAHTVYPPLDPWIVRVINYDAVNPANSQFEVKRFHTSDRSHMPIAELGLRSDEHYYVYIGKATTYCGEGHRIALA